MPTQNLPLNEIENREHNNSLSAKKVILLDNSGNIINPTTNETLSSLKDILSGITRVPDGKVVTKIGFWEDSNGNIKYIKFYDNDEIIFTLEFSNAGESTSETWNITRS